MPKAYENRLVPKKEQMKDEKYLQEFYESEICTEEAFPIFDELSEEEKKTMAGSIEFAVFKLSKTIRRAEAIIHWRFTKLYQKHSR